ncbi:unnamed protein product [Prorocentrum cordatum]|uniref:Uncharacterized protein n=1 Tax=Prorocentrum cordatum TaxID=2364126 RepID=A0ABN9RXA8_9DINO|nr:unnamed protein product [Polarella glacialis]
MRARLLGEPPRSSKTRRAAGLSRTPPLRARGRARQVQAAPANGAGKTGAHLRDSRRRAQREQKTGRRRRSRGRRRRRRRTGRLCPSEKPSAPTPPLRNARRGSPPQPPAWCRPPAPRERRGDKMVVRTSGGLCRARRRSGETLCKPDRPRSRTSWRAGRWAAARRGPGRGCPPPATRLSWGPCWGAAARLKAPRGRGWGPLGGGGAGPPLAVAAARGASAGRPRSSERHSRSSGATAAALQAAVQQARGCKGGRVPTGCASAAGRGRRRTTTTTDARGGRTTSSQASGLL